jgi:hypothetical protein
MVSPESIRRWGERRYPEYLSSLVLGGEMFPLDFRFGKVEPGEATARYKELRSELEELRARSDESGRASYRVEWGERNDRLAGTQLFPCRVYFPDATSFLGCVGKAEEASRFHLDADGILGAFPSLRPWVGRYPEKVVAASGLWQDLVAVLQWFERHSRPFVFLREIPAVEDTKFIERNQSLLRELLDLVLPADAVNRDGRTFEARFGLRQPETLVRVRFLDRTIAARYVAGVEELAVSPDSLARMDFAEVAVVIIVENKASFANLDVLLSLPEIPGGLAIFGSGFAALAFKQCSWMRDRRILYWGDIDTHGLRILAALRQYFPNAESILMDHETFDRFPGFRSTSPPDTPTAPNGLTVSEQGLYTRLAGMARDNRLEQERIPGWWAAAQIPGLIARRPEGRK